MKKKIIFILFLSLLSIKTWAEETAPPTLPDAQFVDQEDTFWIDIGIFDFMHAILLNSMHHVTAWESIALALASIFALLAISYEGFKMLSLDSTFSFMPIARPFVIGLVIFNWAPFIGIVSKPGFEIQKAEKAQLVEVFKNLNGMTEERYGLMDQLLLKVNRMEKEVKMEESADGNIITKTLGKGLDLVGVNSIVSDIKFQIMTLNAKFKMWMYEMSSYLASIIFQLGVFLVLFVQYGFFIILATVGPIVFAFSIIPAFKDLWSAWLMRFLSVTFWGAIAWMMLRIGMIITQVNMETNIKMLTLAVGEDDILDPVGMAFLQNVGIDVSILVSALISTLSLLTVPMISAWVFNTSSVGGAARVMTAAGIGAAAGVAKLGNKMSK